LQPRFALDAPLVDKDTIVAFEILDAPASAQALDQDVVAAHLRVIDHDIVVSGASDGEAISAIHLDGFGTGQEAILRKSRDKASW
jgi:hypothetical protein